MRSNYHKIILAITLIIIFAYVYYQSDGKGEEKLKNSYDEKRIEQEYLEASRLISELIDQKDYKNAIIEANSIKSSFIKSSMLIDISKPLIDNKNIKEAVILLDSASAEISNEINYGLKATTLTILSRLYKKVGNNTESSNLLQKAYDAVTKIDQFDSGAKLSSVFALSKAYAKEGKIAKARSIANLVDAKPGDSLMISIEKLYSESKQK